MLHHGAIALLAASLLGPVAARAQGYLGSGRRLSTLVAVDWEAGFPAAGLRSFAGERSLAGGQVEARLGVAAGLSVGIAGSTNWFAQRFAATTTEVPPATIGGPQYRRVLFTTARLTAHWLLTRGRLQPYLGVGVGGAWSSTYRSAADLVVTGKSFGLAVDPQVGLLWTVAPGLAIHLQCHQQITRARLPDGGRARWLGVGAGVAAY